MNHAEEFITILTTENFDFTREPQDAHAIEDFANIVLPGIPLDDTLRNTIEYILKSVKEHQKNLDGNFTSLKIYETVFEFLNDTFSDTGEGFFDNFDLTVPPCEIDIHMVKEPYITGHNSSNSCGCSVTDENRVHFGEKVTIDGVEYTQIYWHPSSYRHNGVCLVKDATIPETLYLVLESIPDKYPSFVIDRTPLSLQQFFLTKEEAQAACDEYKKTVTIVIPDWMRPEGSSTKSKIR